MHEVINSFIAKNCYHWPSQMKKRDKNFPTKFQVLDNKIYISENTHSRARGWKKRKKQFVPGFESFPDLVKFQNLEFRI